MKYFEKTAFRFNKPGLIKKFNLLTEKEMTHAILRQPLVRKMFGFFKAVEKEELGEFGAARKAHRELTKMISGMKSAGTVFPTSKGKSIGISRDMWKKEPALRRYYLAHEAFHANVPVLGRSEILAHIYGGAKAVKGKKISLKGGALGFAQAVASRPTRVALEAGLVGAGAAGTALGVKKVKKKYFDKHMNNEA